MPAIVTGRHPSQVLWDPEAHTAERGWPGLQLANHTFAEILHEHGFKTGALMNYEYFDPVRRFNQGFDEYDNSNARLHKGNDPASTQGTSSREQSDASIAFIDRHAQDRWLLWVHYYDPHADYQRHPGTQDFGDQPIDLYDQEIRFTDDQIARVIQHLADLHLADKTIIVITGDHGEGFGEHGVMHHGYDLYAAQTKVPLIIYVPGLAPRKVTTPVGHVDILPTLANLAGAPAETTMMGRSLVGLVDGAEGNPDRDVYQEVDYEGPGDPMHGTQKRGLVTQHYHLLYNVKPDNTVELYDLDHDPMETHDVWGSVADEDAMRDRLRDWIDSAQAPPEAMQALADAILDAPPHPAIATPADFGDALHFYGVTVKNPDVQPGEDLDITWYWQVKAALPGNWRPFVHFEGDAGARFVGDHDPVAGALPISRWRPGQIIADHQLVRVPPGTRPGAYTVFMGLYDRAKRQTLLDAGSADGGQNRLRVTTVRVH